MGKAFIFSLDAFTAMFVAIISVITLYLLVNIPEPYFSAFEQAYDYASDGIAFLDSVKMQDVPRTYLGLAITDSSNPSSQLTMLEFMVSEYARTGNCRGGNKCEMIAKTVLGETIPEQFGYSIDFYNPSATGGAWANVYKRPPMNPEAKLRASAVRIITTYGVQPYPGESPYCAITCRGFSGYDSYGAPVATCEEDLEKKLPCEASGISNYGEGKVIGPSAVRLTVFI